MALGLAAGYLGGKIDIAATMLIDGMISFPMLLLALALVALLGPSLPNLSVAIGFSTIPRTARLVRGEVMKIRELEYVEAARSLGATDLRIVRHHILGNVLAPTMVLFSQRLSAAILTEAGLSYLGLGVQPPRPSWGNIIAQGQGYLETGPWVALIPGALIVVTVLGFNLLGDGLRDALDPTLRADLR
jgi:peptide/nickel transport system permease protein